MKVEAIEIRYEPEPAPTDGTFPTPQVRATVIIDGTRYGALIPVMQSGPGDHIHRAFRLAVESMRKTFEHHAEGQHLEWPPKVTP